MMAYRRDTNLCDTLVHGKTNKTVNSIADACESGYTYCTILLRTSIQDALRTADHRPEVKVNCRLQKVVYAISCSRCDVGGLCRRDGETSPGQMREHLRDVRLQRDKSIMSHFRTIHDDGDLRFSVLEKLYNASHTERLLREAMWIKRLKTGRPHGCNVKNVVLPFQLRR